MKYLIPIFLLVFISENGNCQDSISSDYQRIYYCEEIDNIRDFIKEFLSCSNSDELQKHIVFPDFFAHHKCFGSYNSNFGIRPYDSTTKYMSDVEIKEGLDKEGCINPYHFFQIKYCENKAWRDSLTNNGTKGYEKVEADFLSSKKNQMKYLNWFLSEYQFPINTDSFDFRKARINETQFITRRKDVRIMVLSLIFGYFGYHSIEIYKLNGEYKVKGVYVGHD